MTRRQWTGLSGVLFGIAMLVGVFLGGTTPDNGKGAVERYTRYWSDAGHQHRALAGTIVLTFAWVLLMVFAAGLRQVLKGVGDPLHRTIVLAGGVTAAAIFAVAAAMASGPGVAASQAGGYRIDGNDAIFLETIAYMLLTTALMMSAAMAVAFSLANRAAAVVPRWTLVLTVLLALVALGNIATAWIGFVLLPVWALVVGGCLLVGRQGQTPVQATARETVAA